MCHVSGARPSLCFVFQAILLHNVVVINFKTNGVGSERASEMKREQISCSKMCRVDIKY